MSMQYVTANRIRANNFINLIFGSHCIGRIFLFALWLLYSVLWGIEANVNRVNNIGLTRLIRHIRLGCRIVTMFSGFRIGFIRILRVGTLPRLIHHFKRVMFHVRSNLRNITRDFVPRNIPRRVPNISTTCLRISSAAIFIANRAPFLNITFNMRNNMVTIARVQLGKIFEGVIIYQTSMNIYRSIARRVSTNVVIAN